MPSSGNDYLKYSGIAFQMIAIIFVGVGAGRWLDTYFVMEKPIFTVIGSVLFVFLSLYSVLRSLFSKP